MSDATASPRVKATKAAILTTYDGFAPFYAEATVWEEEARETVVARAEIREGQRVLDAGCGPGSLVLEAARRVGPSGRVCGIDLSEKMLEEATKRVGEAGLGDRVELRRADLYEALPFESDSFDVVLSTYVLDLIDTPQLPKLLAELVRVLKPGGRVVLGSWTFGEGKDRRSSDLYTEVYERVVVDFACRPLHLKPLLEKLELRNVEREYIPHVMSSQEARLLLGPLVPRLEAHPDLRERIEGVDSFVFSSEVIWGTKA